MSLGVMGLFLHVQPIWKELLSCDRHTAVHGSEVLLFALPSTYTMILTFISDFFL
jgi:hypothetical protein